jgi:hypothetical protein
MALNIDPNREIKAIDLFVALAMFGQRSNHPYVLMRNMDYEVALISFKDLYDKTPKNVQELLVPAVEEHVETIINNLRNFYQIMVNQLTDEPKSATQEASARYAASVKLREAGKEFIKNNTNDYGGKTVAQIAEELGISKGEVRRRKANGEL